MKWVIPGLFLVSLSLATGATPPGPATQINFPDFPLPKFATDEYGHTQRMGLLRMRRDLQKGGIHGTDSLQAADTEYLMVSSQSLGLLSAWLEASCKSAGIQMELARLRAYDGAVYANLLQVATSIAAARKSSTDAAIPVGVMICKRDKPWGVLSGNGEQDAYIVVATEQGFMVFDPPTRQLVSLADYPNNATVLKIRI